MNKKLNILAITIAAAFVAAPACAMHPGNNGGAGGAGVALGAAGEPEPAEAGAEPAGASPGFT